VSGARINNRSARPLLTVFPHQIGRLTVLSRALRARSVCWTTISGFVPTGSFAGAHVSVVFSRYSIATSRPRSAILLKLGLVGSLMLPMHTSDMSLFFLQTCSFACLSSDCFLSLLSIRRRCPASLSFQVFHDCDSLSQSRVPTGGLCTDQVVFFFVHCPVFVGLSLVFSLESGPTFLTP